VEARLNHPIFEPVRKWLDRSNGTPSLQALNSFSEEIDLRTENGKPVRFVAPSNSDPYYEVHVFETGQVQTRPDNRHDLFNALAWLAFPKTKARINAMHAAEIPRERENGGGKRGRLRDMLTIFDEGGAIVACADPGLEEMIRGFRWKELFSENRAWVLKDLRIHVLGHAVWEQALAPHPGITCKVIFADPACDLDARAASWLAAEGKTPRDLPAFPVFGYPGWFEGSGRSGFYSDERYFRPLQRGKMLSGVGQAVAGPVAVNAGTEESPGSIERDAG
jgi:hypothetical protein